MHRRDKSLTVYEFSGAGHGVSVTSIRRQPHTRRGVLATSLSWVPGLGARRDL